MKYDIKLTTYIVWIHKEGRLIKVNDKALRNADLLFLHLKLMNEIYNNS